jgi:hypothetical protein
MGIKRKACEWFRAEWRYPVDFGPQGRLAAGICRPFDCAPAAAKVAVLAEPPT